MSDTLVYDRDPDESSRFQRIRTWLADAARSAGGWFGPILFVAALVLGLAVSGLWLKFHPRTPVHVLGSNTALVLDPVHKPLPKPLVGADASVPQPAPDATGARIDSPQAPDPAPDATTATPDATPAASQTTDPSQGVSEITHDTPDTPPQAAVAAQPERNPAAAMADSPPRVTSRTEPEYPSDAIPAEGQVRLRVSVGADGDVEEVRIVGSSGTNALDRAAVEAVRSWRYQPAIRGGQPATGQVDVAVDFRLSDQR